jgi:hypothetical protein
MACTGDLTAELAWTGSGADMDFNIVAPAIDPDNLLLAGYEYGTTSPEIDGPVTAGGALQIGVLCWEGPATSWTLTLSFQ